MIIAYYMSSIINAILITSTDYDKSASKVVFVQLTYHKDFRSHMRMIFSKTII